MSKNQFDKGNEQVDLNSQDNEMANLRLSTHAHELLKTKGVTDSSLTSGDNTAFDQMTDGQHAEQLERLCASIMSRMASLPEGLRNEIRSSAVGPMSMLLDPAANPYDMIALIKKATGESGSKS